MKSLILPSLLAADAGRLADEAKRAEQAGADALHLDVMDGHFVPNISMGPSVVEMARREIKIPLNVHLMLSRPDHYVKTFVEAGADSIQIHIESECDVPECLKCIRELGVAAGIALNPDTNPELIFPFLGDVDEVLCMTVRPGYGAQSFMAQVLPSIRRVRGEALRIGNHNLTIMVDGGINRETAGQCAEHGANAFVAGTFLFNAHDMASEITNLRETTTASRPTQ